MKKFFTIALVLALAIPAFMDFASAQGGGLILDDFSGTKVGNFPKRWRTWPFQREKAARVFSVGEESGQKFIKAYDSEDISQEISLNFDWEIDRYPVLAWSWRPTKLPEGADESNDDTNDSACGVYVVVGKYRGHAIKYVWSTGLSTGRVVTRRDGNLKIKVLDSGPSGVGRWASHGVNVPADYEALFGRKLAKNPAGIAILTDGNAVHKPAGCDYKDFSISPAVK